MLDALESDLPQMAEELAAMFNKDAIGMLRDTGLTLDDVNPSVSITYHHRNGTQFRVELSVKVGTEDREDEDADEMEDGQ